MLIQCVPNFSEGRRPEVIAAIVEAVRGTAGVRLADWSADPDHNRLVVTFVGPPPAVRDAALAAAAVAVARIDLGRHEGVHPRLGALDVLPFVPLQGLTLADCAALARGSRGRNWRPGTACPCSSTSPPPPSRAPCLPSVKRRSKP